MDGIVFAVVLVAALLHATWNGFVKNHNDKTVAVTGIVLGHAPLSLLAILYFVFTHLLSNDPANLLDKLS